MNRTNHVNHPQETRTFASVSAREQGRGTEKENARGQGPLDGRVLPLGMLVLLVGAAVWSLFRGGMPERIEGAETVSPSAPSTAGILMVPDDYDTIQAAINAAAPGATITLRPGVYAESITLGSRPITIASTSGAEQTLLVGDGSSRAIVALQGAASGTVIKGLGVAGGDAHSGAALTSIDSDARLEACTFEKNTAGAVSVRGGALTFDDCRFSNNATTLAGGAIACDGGSHTFDGCSFDGNEAGSFGGAVANRGSSLVFLNSSFDDNATRTGAYGGAIYSDGGDITAVGCTLTRNRALDDGGAAFVAGGTARFERCTFTANVAANAWTIASNGCTAAVVDSVICGSDPWHHDGGVSLQGSRFDDACFADCNRNGIDDLNEIASGRAHDDDGNMVPDDCDMIADAEQALRGATIARAH